MMDLFNFSDRNIVVSLCVIIAVFLVCVYVAPAIDRKFARMLINSLLTSFDQKLFDSNSFGLTSCSIG